MKVYKKVRVYVNKLLKLSPKVKRTTGNEGVMGWLTPETHWCTTLKWQQLCDHFKQQHWRWLTEKQQILERWSVFWFHVLYIFDDGNRFANSGTKHPKSHTHYCYLSLLLWATWILPWQAPCRTVKILRHNVYTDKDKTVIKGSADIDSADPLKTCRLEPAQQLPAPLTVSIKRWKMGWMQLSCQKIKADGVALKCESDLPARIS